MFAIKVIGLFITLITLPVHALTCKKDEYKVKEHLRAAHYRKDGTYILAAKISQHCRRYRNDGPLKPTFGRKRPKIWPHKSEIFQKCSPKNIKRINKSLLKLPSALTSAGDVKFYCSEQSYMPLNPASALSDEKIIVFYNNAFLMNLERIIAHELAHILYVRLSESELRSYHKASDWRIQNGVFITQRTKFSAEDGVIDPDEDFSNNIEYYLFERKNFKSDFPKIYKWIKGFFGDNK